MQAGDWIDERYRIIRTLGKGNEGTVYLAVQERIYRFYAIKVLAKDNVCFSEESVELWKRLSHPGLPGIVDVLENETEMLIVMEYIEGEAFSQIPQNFGVPSVHRITSWGRQLCEILQYLHTQEPQIIFGDLKPENLILYQKRVVLVDLGSAIHKDSKGKRTGTKQFRPPWSYAENEEEMIDIYGVGQILGFLASGGIRDAQDPTKWVLKKTDSVLKKIIGKCISPDPKERYKTIGACLHDLKHLYWRGYFLPLLLAGSFLILALASAFEKNREWEMNTRAQYEYTMQKADEHIGREKEAYLREAIALQPSVAESYSQLLESFLTDGSFSVDEEGELRRALLETDEQGISVEERIMNEDPAGFGRLAYQIGMAYWYFYEEINGPVYAISWFQKVLQIPQVMFDDQNARLRSEIYTKLGEYQGKLEQTHLTGREEVSFLDYWKDLHSLLEIPVTVDDGGLTTLLFYKKYLSQILRYRLEFCDAGVDSEEIVEAIRRIRDGYQKIVEKSIVFSEQKDHIREMLTLIEYEYRLGNY